MDERKYNPVEEAYKLLLNAYNEESDNVAKLEVTVYEAIGYLGEALAE